MTARKVTIVEETLVKDGKQFENDQIAAGDVYVDEEEDSSAFIKVGRLINQLKNMSQILFQYSKIILPHLGLILLACFYVTIGAVIFYHMERKNEMAIHQENMRFINEQANYLVEQLSKSAADDLDWTIKASNEIDNLTRIMFEMFDKHSAMEVWQIDETKLVDHRLWTFSAALFFALTLLTTIGEAEL